MSTWPIADLLPHAGKAILIDEIIAFDEDTLVARSQVKAGGIFSLPDGSLAPWLGLEIMAQAVAAWAGCCARQEGAPVELGFLVGTRRYECHVAQFPAGMILTATARRSLLDAGGMGVFDCSLHHGDLLAAAARLNVYRPANAAAFVQEQPVHPS